MSGFIRFIAIIFLACFSFHAVADEQCKHLIVMIDDAKDHDGYTASDNYLTSLNVTSKYKKCKPDFNPFDYKTWDSLIPPKCVEKSKGFTKSEDAIQGQNGTEFTMPCITQAYYGDTTITFEQAPNVSPTLSNNKQSIDLAKHFNDLKGMDRACITATFSVDKSGNTLSYDLSIEGITGSCTFPPPNPK